VRSLEKVYLPVLVAGRPAGAWFIHPFRATSADHLPALVCGEALQALEVRGRRVLPVIAGTLLPLSGEIAIGSARQGGWDVV
jgi:hypothetical protein